MDEFKDLLSKIGELKNIDREGWKRAGIENPESVADHTFRTAFIGLLVGEKFDLDSGKIVKMLLVHDLAEVETGDLTPRDISSRKEKAEKEEQAMEELFSSLEGGEQILNFWREFERGNSKEANIARDIDTLEMVFQALEYEEEYPDIDLSKFIEQEKRWINSSEIESLVESIERI